MGDSVLTHHKNPSRDGVYVQPPLTKAAVTATFDKDPAFTATLDDPNDEVYAQPLFVDGGSTGPDLVIVATEANNVYAFDATTGVRAWKTNVGAFVPLATLATCGNIDRYGITGTPAIDLASRAIFFDALVLPAGGTPKHQIFALSIDKGTMVPGWPIDVAAKVTGAPFEDSYQGQRGALAIVGGRVYVPYGGLFGDCGDYHGRVVGVSISDPTQVQAWATTATAGGVWAPGGIASDGTSLYISTGNTVPVSTWGGGDAVIRLGTGAAFGAPLAYFAPSNWPTLDATGNDLGTAPVLFQLPGSIPAQLLIAFGKDGNAYLLDPANLGGIGSALGAVGSSNASAHVSTNEVISAPAVYTTPTATYVSFRGAGVGCTGGLATYKLVPGNPPTLATPAAWCATAGSGSPMVTTSDGKADSIVWMMGAELNNRLSAFDGDTGAPIAFPGSTVTIPGMRRFNTPIAAKGRIYVASDSAVVAFKL